MKKYICRVLSDDDIDTSNAYGYIKKLLVNKECQKKRREDKAVDGENDMKLSQESFVD